MRRVDPQTGTIIHELEENGRKVTVYFRRNGVLKLWVHERMDWKGNPGTQRGHEYTNFELTPINE